MKRIHILEKKLNEMSWGGNFCAGTDTPYFEDEEGNVYEASWNGDYGFPFGYWPIDTNNEMMFCVGEPWTTHGDACGQAAERYINDVLSEQLGDTARELAEAFSDFESDFQEYGYQYNEEDDNYVSQDGTVIMDAYDFAAEITDKVYCPFDLDEYIIGCIEEYVNNGTRMPSQDMIERYLYNSVGGNYNFSCTDGTRDALRDIDMDFNDYFEMGYGEGRVWPELKMIGFYVTEQPDPDSLMNILDDLQSETDLTVEELLQFNMVFEDWRNNGEVTACTLSDYIDGNYGPNSYEDEEEDETPVQYNNGQKTVFVPHLANQDQKREFFKDFRNTRDQAVYAPREKGAGSLAAYHAMRYPYGESKDRIGKIITEVINKMIKGETK